MHSGPTGLPALHAHHHLPHFLPPSSHGGLHASRRHRSGSGCAVTTYRPTPPWTYQASLVPYPAYQVGYVPAAKASLPIPCGGSASCGGCSCTACGCSSAALRMCPRAAMTLRRMLVVCIESGRRSPAHPCPVPANMSRPPAAFSPSTAPLGRRRSVRRPRCRRRLDLRPKCPDLRPWRDGRPDRARRLRQWHFTFRHVLSHPNRERGEPCRRAVADPEHPARQQRSATQPPARSTSRQRESHELSAGFAGHVLPASAVASGIGPGTNDRAARHHSPRTTVAGNMPIIENPLHNPDLPPS